MERDIKFRVWDKKLQKYVDPSHIYLTGDGTLRTWGDVPLDRERFIVEFSTELNDWNGVEIYDGDIVEHVVTEIANCLVVFTRGRFSAQDGRKPRFHHPLAAAGWKTIGNINENPELLGNAA